MNKRMRYEFNIQINRLRGKNPNQAQLNDFLTALEDEISALKITLDDTVITVKDLKRLEYEAEDLPGGEKIFKEEPDYILKVRKRCNSLRS